MRINQNLSALNAYRNLVNTDNALNKNLERLSSGLRINRAADDAAGLAISEKMRGQVRGLNQAMRNAQDGISMIQTAEGALTETHNILQRMRELAVQAVNDTLTADDRGEIQKEIDQLIKEIDRIATETEFNTKVLLNGEVGKMGELAASSTATLTGIKVTDDTVLGEYAFTASTLATARTAALTTDVDTAVSAAETQLGSLTTITVNGEDFVFDEDATFGDLKNAIESRLSGITVTLEDDVDNDKVKVTIATEAVGSDAFLELSNESGALNGLAAALDGGADATLTGDHGSYYAVGNDITYTAGNLKGLSFTLTSEGAFTLNVTGNSVAFQIGANENQTMELGIGSMTASALAVDGIEVTDAAAAGEAITAIDSAIASVSSERSKLGAYQNRLEHTIANLGVAAENLSAAESRVRDVDMAQEMMQFTRNQILMQAGTAMLAQANMKPQSVLQLLA